MIMLNITMTTKISMIHKVQFYVEQERLLTLTRASGACHNDATMITKIAMMCAEATQGK